MGNVNRLNVKINYQGVNVAAQFNNKWNMLSGYSGTGKTFLMQAIKLFCMNDEIRCVYCDYNFLDKELNQVKDFCKNAEIALLDNADLYITYELFEWFKQTGKLLIICMKDTSKIDMEDVYEYLVNYENMSITIEEY